jgi:hypothetical protein
VPNVAFADQKKPTKTTTTSLGSVKGESQADKHKDWIEVPPKPVGSTLATPKLGGSTGPTVPPKPTQANTNR